MRASARILVVVVAAGLLLLPLRSQEEKQEPAGQAQAEPAKPLEIPEEEKARKNPIAASEESVEAGRRLFASQCAMCHGKSGDGKGDLAVDMKLVVPDFTSAAEQKKRTDGELFYIMTAGHERMPGQGTRLRETQKWHLVNFIRTLAPPEKPKKE